MRTHPLAIAALLCLNACYVGPVFKLSKPAKRSCPTESFLDWTGGLTFHVSQGIGDGSFAYDPSGSLLEKTEGFYDLDSGEYFWWTDYTDDAFRDRDHYSGIGTVWRNGDLDLDGAMEVFFSDDTRAVYDFRQERWGCEETTRIQAEDDEEDLEFISGKYTGGRYEYTHEWIQGSVVAVADGTLNDDLSYTEVIDFEQGPIQVVHAEEGDGVGHATRQFVYDDALTRTEGTWERWRDGSVAMDYFSKANGSKKQFWIYTFDGAGNGQGTWEQDGVTCNLLFEEGDCKRRECSDDANGKCAPPIEAPRP